MEGMHRLDVLDLHDNELDTAAGLEAAGPSLRVLNLSGNRLACVGPLAHLSGLTELNLRRNEIAALSLLPAPGGGAAGDSLPPGLKRLFLSFNRLPSLVCLMGLDQYASLIEVCVEGNPLMSAPPPPAPPAAAAPAPAAPGLATAATALGQAALEALPLQQQLLSLCPPSVTVLNTKRVSGAGTRRRATRPGLSPQPVSFCVCHSLMLP